MFQFFRYWFWRSLYLMKRPRCLIGRHDWVRIEFTFGGRTECQYCNKLG